MTVARIVTIPLSVAFGHFPRESEAASLSAAMDALSEPSDQVRIVIDGEPERVYAGRVPIPPAAKMAVGDLW